MRFPNPVPKTCSSCGQPTVVAETSIGAVRVHCGTWRWQCDTPSVTDRVVAPAPAAPDDVSSSEALAA